MTCASGHLERYWKQENGHAGRLVNVPWDDIISHLIAPEING